MINAFRLVDRFVGLGPNQRILETLGRRKAARRLFNYLSRSCGIFDSFAAAEKARLRFHPTSRGHLNQKLVVSNFSISSQLRSSDYPVLFWLQQISKREALRIFDFGGGQGQAFLAMAPLLGSDNIAEWIVNDLPEVLTDAGSRAFPEGIPRNIKYTSELSEASSSTIFLAAGSLHYWIETMTKLFEELGKLPDHFIVNRSPMRSSGENYFTVQEGGHWAVPCLVRSFPQLQEEMANHGYVLVDRWTAPEKHLHRPWLPEFSCPYQGAYFRRSQ